MTDRKQIIANKLEVMGVQLLEKTDSVASPIVDIYDIHNMKEVATVLCGLANTAVNKQGITGYLSILPDVYPAIADFDQIDEEILDMTIDEWEELKSHIRTELDFAGSPNAYEGCVENIAIHVIGLVKEFIRYGQIKAKNN